MIQHVENEWLTWQRASRRTNYHPVNLYVDPPKKLGSYYPQWFKNLKADVRHYLPDGHHSNHTARLCLGLRGINTLGWTLTSAWNISKGPLEFHPEQLHGTRWSEKDEQGQYIWNIFLFFYPWRAKMAKGFRLLIADYPLDFGTDWHTFSGCVDANYRVDEQQQLGSMYWYDEPIDPEYNYFNVETVVAIKKGCFIPANTVTFTMVPVWDPEYTGITKQIPDLG
jgi:hypothetical protein